MKFNFPFSWYNKFGTIPETYKEAMSYEEQILWLCKHQEDLEIAFEEFKVRVDELEVLVNSFDTRITKNADDITALSGRVDTNALDISSLKDTLSNGVPFKYLEENLVLNNTTPTLNRGYYFTSIYKVISTIGGVNVDLIPENTLFYYEPLPSPYFKVINEVNEKDLTNYYVKVENSDWVSVRQGIVQAINSSSTYNEIASGKAVYDFVTSFSPQQVIEELSQSISLADDVVPLTTGLYYTGQYNITTPTGTFLPDPILMIPSYTLFYYDGTQNSFTLIYNEHTPNRTTWLNERWTWDSVGLAWEQLQYNVTDEITSFASHTKVVTEYAVYQAIGNVESVLQTLNSGSGVE